MADEYVIRVIPESVSGGTRGKGGGMLGGLGLGKLGALLAIGGIVLSVIKPMLPMIKGLGKMIGEFLRPIAEVIMMLLAPILALMRPILITFKALMAPFKQAAMTGIAAAQKLIGQGMQLGMETPEGAALIGEGFKGSLSAASLMFSGFIETLFTPLAEMFSLGDQFAGAMDKWQDSALEGVHRVLILSGSVDELSEGLGGLREGTVAALSVIDEQIAILRKEVNMFTIENFQRDMGIAQDIIETTALLAVGDFEGAKIAAENLNTPFAAFTGYMNDLYDILPDAAEGMRKYSESMSDIAKSQAIMGAMAGHMADEPSWWDKFKGGWKSLVSEQDSLLEAINPFDVLSDFGKGWKKTYTNWEKEGEETQAAITKLLNAGNTSFETSIDKSTKKFKNFGNTVEGIAGDAADAARDARRSADSAAKAAKKARANADSSALGAVV